MGLFVNPINYPSAVSFTESMDIINEAYFGSDMLKDAQKYLSEYRADLMARKTLLKSAHPAVMKFNAEMERIFGFYIFNLAVVEGKVTNACTMPVSWRVGYNHRNPNKCTFNRKTGYKYDPDLKYSCSVMVYSGLMLDPMYTDREIMAVILHEIGHNFQEVALDYEGNFGLNFIKTHTVGFIYLNLLISAILDSITQMNPVIVVQTATGIVRDLFLNSIAINGIFNKVDRMFLDTFPPAYRGLEVVQTVLDKIRAGIMDFFNSFSYIYTTVAIANPILILLNMGIQTLKGLNPLNMVTLGIRYNDEKFADNFATMYGYGPECASVQAKFERYAYGSTAEDVINKIPVLNTLADFVWAPIIATATMFDEHPYSKTRMLDQAILLEKELERSTTNPRMKQQIKKEMIEIRAIAAAFDEAQKRSMTTTNTLEIEPKVYTVMCKEIVYNLFGNTDFAAGLVNGFDTHEMIDKKFR